MGREYVALAPECLCDFDLHSLMFVILRETDLEKRGMSRRRRGMLIFCYWCALTSCQSIVLRERHQLNLQEKSWRYLTHKTSDDTPEEENGSGHVSVSVSLLLASQSEDERGRLDAER